MGQRLTSAKRALGQRSEVICQGDKNAALFFCSAGPLLAADRRPGPSGRGQGVKRSKSVCVAAGRQRQQETSERT